MKLTHKQLVINAAFCLTLLAVILWAFYSEYNRPWKKYQKEKIQQIYLQEIGETDRCVTCHQGADKPAFSNKPQPFKTHSGDYLKHHKVEKFGCAVCHDGQGAALTVDTAHGNVKNWTKPVLKGSYAQSSCAKCHLTDQELSLNIDLQGASVFTEGRRLFNEYNCVGCHKLTAYKRPDYIAPALTSAGSKVSREWLIKWLKNPKDYLASAKMPKFNLRDEEIGYIADYLMGLKSPLPPFAKGGDTPLNPLLIEGKIPPLEKGDAGGFSVEGKKLFSELGCLGCHAINSNGSGFAPDLSDIGNKVNSDWLLKFLKNPKVYQSKSSMPDLKLSDQDIQSVAAYLIGLKKNTLPLIPSHQGRGNNQQFPLPLRERARERGVLPDNIDIGRKLIKDKGCTGCHEIENLTAGYDAPPLDGIGSKRVDELVFSNITGIDKTLMNWLLIKVQSPQKFATDKIVTRMPDYGFSKEQSKALVTFLLSIQNTSVPAKYVKTLINPGMPEIKGSSILEKYNCLGCHKIKDKGGDIGPDISFEGRKSRPDWLFTFLKSPYKIRPLPMLKAGMPNFNLSDSEVNTIIEYLAFIAVEPYPYEFEPKKEINTEDIWNGEKLYHEIFACSGCHSVDGHGGQVGPDHSDLANRLKREWIKQWLQNPQAVKPDVIMPGFKFKDWELEALTDYLMTLGKYRFVDVKSAN